jgi:signal transduction histidine kinase
MLEALRSGEPAAIVDAPGLGALPALAEAQALGRAGAISLTIAPEVGAAVDQALDRAAYRIVEEAIRNARRHAGPVAIDVTASIEAGDLHLVVVNATGRPTGDEQGSGLGLVGMRERAAVFGGAIEAGPTPEGGFRVEARLPLGAGAGSEAAGSAGTGSVAAGTPSVPPP